MKYHSVSKEILKPQLRWWVVFPHMSWKAQHLTVCSSSRHSKLIHFNFAKLVDQEHWKIEK